MIQFTVIFFLLRRQDNPYEWVYQKNSKNAPQRDNRIILKGVRIMKTLNEFFNQQMQDPEFRSEYEKIQPEMDIIRAIVDARLSQNLTQKELAERTGINQADISKLENGTRNPSLKLLQRLADGMDMILKIEFIPKPKHK